MQLVCFFVWLVNCSYVLSVGLLFVCVLVYLFVFLCVCVFASFVGCLSVCMFGGLCLVVCVGAVRVFDCLCFRLHCALGLVTCVVACAFVC